MEEKIDVDKIELVQEYIDKCEEVAKRGNPSEAENLQNEIDAVFGHEMEGLHTGLDSYSIRHYGGGTVTDWIGDAELLRRKLINYKVTLQERKSEREQELELARLRAQSITVDNHSANTATATAEASAVTQVSFEQVTEVLNQLPDNILSKTEKEELEDKLAAVEANKNGKDKGKLAEKIGAVLKYIVDKGVEVGIAVLPYLGKIAAIF